MCFKFKVSLKINTKTKKKTHKQSQHHKITRRQKRYYESLGTLVYHGKTRPMTIEQIVNCAARTVEEHGNYNYIINNCQTFANNFIKKICIDSQGSKLGLIHSQQYLKYAFGNAKITRNPSLIHAGNISINYSQIEQGNKAAKRVCCENCLAILSAFLFVFFGVWWIFRRLF